jgi:hypothetical protein
MTDLIANDDDERRWGTDRAEFFVETEGRGWENRGDRWREAEDANPAGAYRQGTTATARFGRSILIIAALSTLSWAAVILVVIAALSAL